MDRRSHLIKLCPQTGRFVSQLINYVIKAINFSSPELLRNGMRMGLADSEETGPLLNRTPQLAPQVSMTSVHCPRASPKTLNHILAVHHTSDVAVCPLGKLQQGIELRPRQ